MQQIPRNCTYLDDFPTFMEIVTHDDNLLGNFTKVVFELLNSHSLNFEFYFFNFGP